MAAKMRTLDTTDRLDAILHKNFVARAEDVRERFIEVGDEKYVMPIPFKSIEEKIRNFEVYDDDVILAAFPKTGTTWASEMIWMIMNNFDYEGGKKIIQMRLPLLEFSGLLSRPKKNDMFDKGSVGHAESLKRPRTWKTHLGFSLLPEQIRNGTKRPKIITVLRNPKDVCISLYRHITGMKQYVGTVEEYYDLFLGGRVPFAPFWENVLSYWRQKDNLNILFIQYKDMKEDLPSVIRKIAEFLEKPVTEAEIAQLVQHLQFDSMQKNSAVNFKSMVEKYATKSGSTDAQYNLVRSGKVGGYKIEMAPELIAKFDEWTKEKIAGSGMESIDLE